MTLIQMLRRPVAALGRILRAATRPTEALPNTVATRYVVPSARDRWLTASLSSYTPDYVEQVLRGAFAGDLTCQWQLFDLMEQTWPRLAKNLNELKQALEDHEWTLQAWTSEGEEASEEAQRRKRVVEHILWHTDPDPTLDENDFSDLCRDLADAWGKGVSVQELDWSPMAYDGGTVVGLRAARWVHPRCYGYPATVDGPDRLMLRASELEARRLDGGGAPVADARVEWLPFPKDKFVIGIAKQKTGHPIGGALLRVLAWWWAVSNFSAEWLVNLAQIFGVPIRWATYAQGTPPDQIKLIEQMAADMGSAGWAVMPAGTTMEIKEALKSGTDNPQRAVLDLADKFCDLVVLGQTLTSDAGDRGTQALGTVHAGVLAGRKRALVKWVAKTLNGQFLPAICRLNFGDTAECPYFVVGEEDDEDRQTKAMTFKTVLESGAAIPRRHYYDELGIPQPEDGDDVIEPRAAPALPYGGGGGAGSLPDMFRGTRLPGTVDTVAAQARATAGQRKLAEAVAESVTGVEQSWLGGTIPWFERLIAAAQDPGVSEAEFEVLVSRARASLPDQLAPLLHTRALAEAMERNMGAAMANGAVNGWLNRQRGAAA